MKNLSAGDLRHVVTVVRALDIKGTATQILGPYRALVECLGGSEVTVGNHKGGLLKYKVTLRAGAGPIRPSDKIVYLGKELNVVAAVPDPFNIMIEVDATHKPVLQ